MSFPITIKMIMIINASKKIYKINSHLTRVPHTLVLEFTKKNKLLKLNKNNFFSCKNTKILFK